MTGRDFFKRFEIFIIVISNFFKIFPYNWRCFFFDLFSSFPSSFGVFIRYCILRTLVKSLGRNVYIGRYSIIKNYSNLIIGDNVSIHEFCFIDAIGGIEIGNNVSIAHSCSLVSFEHIYTSADYPIKYSGIEKKTININDDVWLGANVKILSGSHINSRVVVGAQSLVKGELLEKSLYLGSPVKRIKSI
ncbi:acyltransferase [Vibrio sp. Vb2535]|uniref:acyltransferase n=1 Tax=Vibrio TaxID=662 RepID=UPI002964AD3E|nr:acyltransferase [Vibrio sp. Vb2535]MDW1755881.1 acyltransferase [Vibrio sp. Vb2535]